MLTAEAGRRRRKRETPEEMTRELPRELREGRPDPADPDPGQLGLGQLDPADPTERARQICLRMLAAAPRTRAQLAGALRRKAVPDETAEAILGRLAEVGLVDDAAFARAWVESRHHGRGLARRALTAELTRRGVAGEDTAAAVGALDPAEEM